MLDLDPSAPEGDSGDSQGKEQCIFQDIIEVSTYQSTGSEHDGLHKIPLKWNFSKLRSGLAFTKRLTSKLC